MNTFRKWNGKRIEDWGSVMSDDAKSFYKAFKNFIKRSFPDCEIVGFRPNHYDFSGFIKKPDGRCIYISHDIDRAKERVDFNDSSVMNGVLYRTAKDEKDYRGGNNNFCSIFKLVDCVNNLFDRMEVPQDEPVTESKQINERLYNQDEIQAMLTKCHQDAAVAKKVLAQIKDNDDRNAIADVIKDGYIDRFDRYDSAVSDKFITAFELTPEAVITESNEMSYTVYNGYDISYNFYGQGEYTVQYCGDDVMFHSEDEAKAFIDKINSGELDEATIKEAKSRDFEGELELEYLISFKDRIDQDDFKAITEYLNEYLAGNKPELKTGRTEIPYGYGEGDFVGFNGSKGTVDVDDEDQTLEYFGYLTYYVPDGEPGGSDADGPDDAGFQEILRKIILSAPAASDITPDQISFRTLSKPVGKQYEDNWDSYCSRLAYADYLSEPDPDRAWKELHGESININQAVDQVLEGKSLEVVVKSVLEC